MSRKPQTAAQRPESVSSFLILVVWRTQARVPPTPPLGLVIRPSAFLQSGQKKPRFFTKEY